MNYQDPTLRTLLAGEYVLGTMPSLARRRFERLMDGDTGLARLVGEWADHLQPINDALPASEPPARVWRAIEREIGPPVPQRSGWLTSLALWRLVAGTAVAALAAVVVYVAVQPQATAPEVVAILNDAQGAPVWLATTGPDKGSVVLSAIRPETRDPAHVLELWAIAGGKPRPLGLIDPAAKVGLAVSRAAIHSDDAVLAVSIEPPGGSPTGRPTGPVVYQGKLYSQKI